MYVCMAKGAALVDILEVVVLQQTRKSCDANLQRQRELQKQNKTTTTICLISELSFPPYRRGLGYTTKFDTGRLRLDRPTHYPFVYHF